MRKFIGSWNFGIHFIFSLVLTLVVGIIARFVIIRHAAASIGIIGGADGPTTIYISNKMTGIFLSGLLYVVLFIVLLSLYVPVKAMIGRKHGQ